MKKFLGILTILLGVFGGLAAILMNHFSSIRAYGGYCDYTKLPNYGQFILVEALFTILLFALVTYSYFFDKLTKTRTRLYNFILAFLLGNYAFMAIELLKSPRVLIIPIWNTEPPNDQFLGLAFHPFAWILPVYAIVLLALNYRLYRKLKTKFYHTLIWFTITIAAIALYAILSNIEYEMCAG